MATIPASATTLRHVRKTITFDGEAGSGATGAGPTIFTITGRVYVTNLFAYCSESLAGANAQFSFTVASGGWDSEFGLFFGSNPITATDVVLGDLITGTGTVSAAGGLALNVSHNGWVVADDIYVHIATAAITDGTLIVDAWYYPITDDGALAGDDHDQAIDTIINAEADTALADYDPPTKAELDSAVSPLATSAALSTVDSNVDSILADTGTDGVVVAAASKTGYRLSSTGVDDVLDEVVEGTWTFRQMLRLFASVLLGKVSGAGTTTNTFRDIDDSKDRVTATVTAAGNRTAVTKDGD